MSARKDARQPLYQAAEERKYLAKQIKGWRVAKGQTKRNLSRLAGFPASALVRLEEADADPKFSTLVRLAKALDISVMYLLFTDPTTHCSTTELR